MVDTASNIGLLNASQNTLKSASSLAQNFENFLTLLTTQLQNQDPLSPMDSTQFTTQLVQFASVEQQIGQNARLDEIVKIQGGSQAVSAVNFLDNIVEAFGRPPPRLRSCLRVSVSITPRTMPLPWRLVLAGRPRSGGLGK
jgi:flagellar basal-body rod modification protein FlgD